MNCRKCNNEMVQFMIEKWICVNEKCEIENLIQSEENEG